jgi:hypothetical protein
LVQGQQMREFATAIHSSKNWQVTESRTGSAQEFFTNGTAGACGAWRVASCASFRSF